MDRLMLTDIETMTDLNENPVAAEPITKNCGVKIYDEIFNNLSVRSSKDSDLKPIKSFLNQVLIRSDIYQNRYYPLENLSEIYVYDPNRAVFALSLRMGIKSYEFSYETQLKEHLSTNFGADFNTEAKTKGVGGELNASANLNENKTQTQHTHQIQKHENMNETPVSGDELAQFIKDGGINLNALPSFFGERVKLYLQTGQISGSIENCEKLSYSLEENTEFLASLNAQITLLSSFISANLNMNFAQKRTYEFAKSITYKIKF